MDKRRGGTGIAAAAGRVGARQEHRGWTERGTMRRSRRHRRSWRCRPAVSDRQLPNVQTVAALMVRRRRRAGRCCRAWDLGKRSERLAGCVVDVVVHRRGGRGGLAVRRMEGGRPASDLTLAALVSMAAGICAGWRGRHGRPAEFVGPGRGVGVT